MSEPAAPWQDFAEAEPDLAARVRARFEWTKHHVLATLRRDGAPRVSGTEVQFHGDDLTIGMMHGSVKARDLVRDGRFALHSNPGEPTMEGGDAKVSGVAHEVTDADELAGYVDAVQPPPPFHLFRCALTDVVLTSLHPDGDRLLIETWRPGEGLVVRDRR